MWTWSVGKVARLAVVVGVLAVGLGFAGVSGAAGQTVADIEVRDRLVADQEALLNVYRCMFGVDVEVVPGGCADGAPALPAKGPAPFAGVPTAGDLAVRDQLVADQEALLNVYRCQFNIDTELVPDGCPTTQTGSEEVDELSCEIFMRTADSMEIRCTAPPTASEPCQPVDGWVIQYWFPFSDTSVIAHCGVLLCPNELVNISEWHNTPSPGGQSCVHRTLVECSQEALFFQAGRLACWEGDTEQIPDYRGVIYPCPVGYVFVWWYASDMITYTQYHSPLIDGIKGKCYTVAYLRTVGVEIVE